MAFNKLQIKLHIYNFSTNQLLLGPQGPEKVQPWYHV